MLMISNVSKKRFSVQTLVDNVSLLTKEVLDEINQVVVAKGHKELKHGAKEALRCRADSAVARTNVEWPTDVRLLCDALRSLVNELYGHCKSLGMKGWRKARWWVKRLTTAYRRCRKVRKNGFLDRVRQFLAVARQIITKALGCVIRRIRAPNPIQAGRVIRGNLDTRAGGSASIHLDAPCAARQGR